MFRIFGRLILAAIFVYGGIYTWNHLQQQTTQAHAAEPETGSRDRQGIDRQGTDQRVIDQHDIDRQNNDPQNSDPQNKPFASVNGPLANLLSSHKPSQSENNGALYKPSPEDHIQESPVGSSRQILHRTFPVGRYVHVAFEIPPHAVTPRFHGTFSSYPQGGGNGPSHDEEANVDILLMNEQQYAAFAAGHDPDVLLVADTSHYQDINFDLAPSFQQAVKYHLVFRNSPAGSPKKIVKADFVVDF